MISRRFLAAVFGALTALNVAPQRAQAAPPNLIDHLAGRWVMTGKLGSKTVIHDVNAQWILNREYIQFHEISRTKSPSGAPDYEAIVYISWSAQARQYACLWLDSTAAAMDFQPIGHATQRANSIPFIIMVTPKDALHTTFTYDAHLDRWHLTIDDVNQGKTTSFGDVQLVRAK